ncbi:DNA (cytosine-5-)-methyltransferase [Waddlia chondrophila]|uniref:Cytosine-specific methyltransferase n=1 Tax=Waddlia chondrophila (strain ATCC VR-1470 / WSU 86-1044) TaxID=716544 RepID=D6YSI9_WADCW|nr:DNA (cytosine-5-)-methyltransferase [Waddlia chondrophila]ADI39034.1 C-5 cytosine-specific DNA methylase [Waddlia chondrophila WSU 86-1044]
MSSLCDDFLVKEELLADILSVSKRTLKKWKKEGVIVSVGNSDNGVYNLKDLKSFEPIKLMLDSSWESETKTVPKRDFLSVELFAGAGGLALGLEKAGLCAQALNEIDKSSCMTLRKNRPSWNVIEGDIKSIDFRQFKGIDFLSGGFPCQAFSYAGQKKGFEDARGTLFFDFARVIKETKPKVFLGENVRGLLNHDNGNTISVIKSVIEDIGYTILDMKVLKSIFYQVPQKRERLFIVGVRNDLVKKAKFKWPSPFKKVLTLKDALKQGSLYDSDVPTSNGQLYPQRKKEILSHVPQGGYWKDLSEELQKEYMQNSFYLGGGKTGMARRLSWNEPSLTLTCSPSQKQTERCHPEETRPLTVREYARIQTFPDDWEFSGSMINQYKQIGNAVPVNLSWAVGRSIVRLLNSLE